MAVEKSTSATLRKGDQPFTTVVNEVVQTVRNPDALALWVYLQSKSAGWRVIGSHLQEWFGIGQSRYRAAMRNLREHGLITDNFVRGGSGRISEKEIIVHASPWCEKIHNVDKPISWINPSCGQMTPYEKKEDSTKGKIENLLLISEPEPKPRDQGFETWWKEYPRKVAKDAARRAYFSALRRGATPGELLSHLKAFEWHQDANFRPYPATWLNSGRWQDEDGLSSTPSAPAAPPDHPWWPDMSDRISPAHFRQWIEPLTIAEDDGTTVFLTAPSAFFAAHVMRHYEMALRHVLGKRVEVRGK